MFCQPEVLKFTVHEDEASYLGTEASFETVKRHCEVRSVIPGCEVSPPPGRLVRMMSGCMFCCKQRFNDASCRQKQAFRLGREHHIWMYIIVEHLDRMEHTCQIPADDDC